MRLPKWVVTLSCAAVLSGVPAYLVSAADEKATDAAKPAVAEEKAEKPAKKSKAVKLVKPWSDMTSLTEEQKAQITEIHRKAVAEIKQIQQKEKDAIVALLNDQQKAEHAALVEKKAAEGKAKKPAADAGKASAEKAG